MPYACCTIPTTERSWEVCDGRTGDTTWPTTFSPIAFRDSIRDIASGSRSIPLLLRHGPNDVCGTTAAGDFSVAESLNGLAVTIWTPRALTFAKGVRAMYGACQLSFGASLTLTAEQRDGGTYVLEAFLKEITLCPVGSFPTDLRFFE